MKKRFIAAVFALTFVFCSCANGAGGTDEATEISSEVQSLSETSMAEEKPVSEQFKYTVNEYGVYITGYIGGQTVVTIPTEIDGTKVCKVSDSAFRGSRVEELIIPEGMTQIKCIKGAYHLKKLVLPSTADTIDTLELAYLPKLGDIEVAEGGNFIASNGALFSADGKTLVFAFDCGDDYAVPEGTEEIGKFAFSHKKLRSVSFPSTLKTIGQRAFEDCENLLKTEIPSSVTTIGSSAFMNSGLAEVKLNEGLKSIGDAAFSRTDISKILLPQSIEEVGELFIDSDCKITAYEPIKSIMTYDVTYLNKPTAETAERVLPEIPEYNDGRFLLDINFDGVPECFDFDINGTGLYHLSEYYSWFPVSWFDGRLYHYYDKDNDCDFYTVWDIGEGSQIFYRGLQRLEPLRESIVNEPIGNLTNYGGELKVGSLNGHFYMEESDDPFSDLDKYINDAMSGYELAEVIDFNKLAEGQDSSEKFQIKLDPIEKRSSKPLKTYDEYKAEDFFEIGDISYYKYEFNVYPRAAEDLDEFLKFPNLTSLDIYLDIDSAEPLTKFKNIKELRIYSYIKDPSALAKMDGVEKLYVTKLDSYDFLSGMDGVRAIEFYPTTEEPDDFFKLLKGMKSLKYLIADNYCDMPITDGQLKWLEENMPEIKVIIVY